MPAGGGVCTIISALNPSTSGRTSPASTGVNRLDPVGREAGGEHGDADDRGRTPPGDGGVPPHHLPVAEDVGPAELHLSRRVGQVASGPACGHVLDRDRLGARVAPTAGRASPADALPERAAGSRTRRRRVRSPSRRARGRGPARAGEALQPRRRGSGGARRLRRRSARVRRGRSRAPRRHPPPPHRSCPPPAGHVRRSPRSCPRDPSSGRGSRRRRLLPTPRRGLRR